MSNAVPERDIGDRIRIMQTTEAEKQGLANEMGTVRDVDWETDINERLAYIDLDNGSKIQWPLHSLQGAA